MKDYAINNLTLSLRKTLHQNYTGNVASINKTLHFKSGSFTMNINSLRLAHGLDKYFYKKNSFRI